jgi:hypothetical protein
LPDEKVMNRPVRATAAVGAGSGNSFRWHADAGNGIGDAQSNERAVTRRVSYIACSQERDRVDGMAKAAQVI